MTKLGCLCWLGLLGCVPDSDTGDAAFEPEAVRTGIYTMTVTRDVDTCDPPGYTGRMDVLVTQQRPDLLISEPRPAGVVRFQLLEATGYALRSPPDGRTLNGCLGRAADSIVRTDTLTEASSRGLTVVSDESWTIDQPCPITVLDVPKASCSATHTLRYDLVTACDAPCRIVVDSNELTLGGLTAHCSCGPDEETGVTSPRAPKPVPQDPM